MTMARTKLGSMCSLEFNFNCRTHNDLTGLKINRCTAGKTNLRLFVKTLYVFDTNILLLRFVRLS